MCPWISQRQAWRHVHLRYLATNQGDARFVQGLGGVPSRSPGCVPGEWVDGGEQGIHSPPLRPSAPVRAGPSPRASEAPSSRGRRPRGIGHPGAGSWTGCSRRRADRPALGRSRRDTARRSPPGSRRRGRGTSAIGRYRVAPGARGRTRGVARNSARRSPPRPRRATQRPAPLLSPRHRAGRSAAPTPWGLPGPRGPDARGGREAVSDRLSVRMPYVAIRRRHPFTDGR
jgi:hypothetical protein